MDDDRDSTDVCDYAESALRKFVQGGKVVVVDVSPGLGHVGREGEPGTRRRLGAGAAGVGEQGDTYEGHESD